MTNEQTALYETAWLEGAMLGQTVFWSTMAAAMSLAVLGGMIYYRFVEASHTVFTTGQWGLSIVAVMASIAVNLIAVTMGRIVISRARSIRSGAAG